VLPGLFRPTVALRDRSHENDDKDWLLDTLEACVTALPTELDEQEDSGGAPEHG
jgi:hypothetical protein